ncbi:sensor histidine kinase [Curtobacterium ammoniigenes]|uniref:sensor histidine kinase n=1 Tax=Curtobacterium ammoniigenes TaxID=395387 RepID=UPI00082C597A|nr:HAMP domain-containing sensor histidine kinase [Curtobacterium ammoniigenes]
MSSQDPDRRIVQRSALSIGVQVAIISALLVIAIFAIFVGFLWWQSLRREAMEPHDGDIRIAIQPIHVVVALVSIGGFSIALAGLASWFIARRATRPIEDALRLQRTFVSDASHELRTPLTVLDARMQRLARVLDDSVARERVLGQLRDDMRSMRDLVDDLLETATLRDRSPGEEYANLRTELGAALDDMQLLAERRGVRFEVRSAEAAVQISPTALRRSLVILVDNAIAHSPDGGVVGVFTRVDGNALVIDVADQGPGIRGIDPERVFDRFAHGTATTIDPGHRTGFGIGLALLAEIAGRFGGAVRVSATSPAGTVFTLRLPLAGARTI